MAITSSSRKRVVLLGATGSIGENALRVIQAHPDRLELVAIAARSNHGRLAEIAAAFPTVRQVALYDEAAYRSARESSGFPAHVRLHCGPEGLNTLASLPDADIVLVAVVGTTGLAPAIAALQAGKDLALASKEILVLAGKFVMAEARARARQVLPVDSEHNAVFQCVQGHPSGTIARIILTASGGAFRDWPLERLVAATPADALRHPNWSMGPKITVDSATMANKGLELIEAQWLFGLRPEQCDAVLHAQSLVHCLVEFTDGAMLSQLCPPSMTFPIQHALLHPERPPGPERALDLSRPWSLDFRPVDEARYPMLRLAREVMRTGGTAPGIYNAANEIAVEAFLQGHLPYLAIPRIVEQTLSTLTPIEPPDLPAVLSVDAEARQTARRLIGVSLPKPTCRPT
jgi:1-deoxy-D-xylulose-5-phosphate reductoisomerase